MALKFKKLKRGIYTSPQTGDIQMERYIIENQEDLKAFVKVYPQLKQMGMQANWSKSIAEGRILIATDEHPMTGFPTYCFEHQSGEEHPSDMNRLKVL